MDRNAVFMIAGRDCIVALRKESVDRNADASKISKLVFASLSARRAWIEIQLRSPPLQCKWSLSARRAWIEIAKKACVDGVAFVALRKESVDRNAG